MTERRALLALVAGALAVGLVWWSPSLGEDEGGADLAPSWVGRPESPSGGPASTVTGRSLAAALVAHLDTDAITGVSGTDGTLGPMASVAVDDGWDTGYFVSLDQRPGGRARCHPHALVCRRLEDGTLISVRAGKELVGRAHRPDASVLLVASGDDGHLPPAELAAEILADPEIGGQPSDDVVAAGEALEDYEDLVLELSAREVGLRP